MKKLLIGLLIAAAGTGVYFLLQNRKKADPPLTVNDQDWLIGKWTDKSGELLPDSLATVLQWEFRKDGIAIVSNQQPLINDTLQYAWKDSASLGIRSAKDSMETVFRVIHSANDSLVLERSDSSRILLGRSK